MHDARVRVFNPEAIKVMQAALDDARDMLRPAERAQMSRTTLAVHILEAAAEGERDRERLRTRALTKTVWSSV